jgi:hypothetical protein
MWGTLQLVPQQPAAPHPVQVSPPSGLTHVPFVHVEPEAQVMLHPPQWFTSVCSLTQAPEHGLWPPLQEKPHEVPSHVSVPLAGGDGQAEQLVPQELSDVLLTHDPLQVCDPVGQAHVPL